jgi:hypothetical protein
MPKATLGKKRDKLTIVKATANIYYSFATRDLAALPGVGADDLTALGHLPATTAVNSAIVVLGANAPRPARFRKRLSSTADNPITQESITTFGDGTSATSVNAAGALGWRMVKPPTEVGMGATPKGKNVAVRLSNGAYAIRNVPTDYATEANATLLGWETSLSDATIAKAVRGAKNMKPATVKKRLEAGGVVTLPCKKTKLSDAYNAGYVKGNPEFIGDATVIPE